MKTSNTPIATAFSIRLPDPTRYDDMEYICEGVIERLQDSAWDMVYKNLQSLAAAPDNVREALDECETPVNPDLPIIDISDLAALAFATTYPRPGSPCSLLGLAEYLEWDMQPYPATFSYAARLAFEGDHLTPAINDWLEDVITDDLIFSVNTNPDALNQYWDTLEKAAASPAD